jgi:hypothetical protein
LITFWMTFRSSTPLMVPSTVPAPPLTSPINPHMSRGSSSATGTPVCDPVGGQHPAQGVDRADGQVDAAGDDHERHAERDHGEEGALQVRESTTVNGS